MVTDRPCTRNAATATPDSTTHQRCRSAYVIVINCDLSPSSATKTTPRLMSVAVSMSDLSTRRPAPQSRGHRTSGRRSRPPLPRFAGRARVRQRVDTTIVGYSPSLTHGERRPDHDPPPSAAPAPPPPQDRHCRPCPARFWSRPQLSPHSGDYGADAVDRRRARQDGSRTQSPGAVRDPSRVSHRGGLRGHPSF